MEKPLLKQKFDETPWTIQQTFLGIFLTLVPWVVIAFLLSSTSGGTTRTQPLSPQADLAGAIVVFIFSALIEGAFLIAPFYFANHAFRFAHQRRRLVSQALGLKRFAVGSTILWIVTLFLAFLAINGLYQYIITTLHLPLQTNDQFILEHSKNAPFTTYATLITAVFVAPFCEEVFFRGFVFPGLLRGMPLGAAMALSALLFAIAHADIGSFAPLFFIGLALAFLRWRTRSIWPGFLLHLLNNGFAAILIVLAMQGIVHQS